MPAASIQTSTRTRLLLALLAVAVLAAGALSAYFLNELEAYGMRKLGERLGREAQLVAAVAANTGLTRSAELQKVVSAVSPLPNSQIIIVNAKGTTVADSRGEAMIGRALTDRGEIASALAGESSAIARPSKTGKTALYVAYPIERGGHVVGVAYISAETFSISTLLRDYRWRMLGVIALFIISMLAVAELMSRWLTAPLARLEVATTRFAAGDHSVRVAPSGPRETRALASAFNTMADEVERVVSELRAEERLKSQFVSDVSHELRTPLTAIRGAAETLLDGDVPPADAERFLATIIAESNRLTRLANDLLALQRIEGATGELPLRVIDLRTAAERVASAFGPLMEDRGVELTIHGHAPSVLGDLDRLQQVIANLVDNASRFVGAGGHVRVELGAEGDWGVLSVLDDGPGIPAEDLERLFDRFYRSQPSRDRSSGGAGLGLAIVKAIVTAHGGQIEATNLPEGGSRFRVRLPALRD
jgi:two-component system OmpR family sensor kinase